MANLSIPHSKAGRESGVASNLDATKNFAPEQMRGTNLSVYASWAGTPTGTFALQCSFDGGTTFTTVPGASAEFTANGNAQPAGGASSAVWNWSNVPGNAWRLVYTRTSGSGALTYYYAMV